MAEPLEIEFDRLTPQGMATGKLPGSGSRVAVAWGVLPGERARVVPLRRRKGTLLCRVEEILAPSAGRIAPCEPHYLSCSPWQVMSYAAQLRSKRAILEELFPGVPLSRLVEAETVWGYRNKLEFSFTEEQGRLQLAFHQRASAFRKVALPEGCRLGSAAMNAAALEVVERLAERGIGEAALKSLVVRGSAATGEVILGLYVMDEAFTACDVPLERSAGMAVIYSDPLSPASVATKVLSRRGSQRLTERVAGLELAFPLEGFFQNHAEVFALAVEEIRRHTPDRERLVELYSGVGSIGIALRDRAREILAVESSEAAVEFAEENRRRIGAENYHPRAARAEACAEEILSGEDVVVVDPPRSGLHPKLIAALLRTRPRRILYLSCNPANLARDVGLLGPCYRPVTLIGFDFYPQTPHIESLAVLDRDEASAGRFQIA
jgi:23S rRNA (uracil1939-C5)-methyltransferase